MNNTPKTALDICNLALKKLGEPDAFLISSFNPDGVLASRLCYMHYHPCRREVICAARWDFAKRTVTLAEPKQSFTYFIHQLPTDALRVLAVSVPIWTLRGCAIWCEQERIRLEYMADVEDVEQFEELFIEAVATRLACKICIPMTNSTRMLMNLREEYETLIKSYR